MNLVSRRSNRRSSLFIRLCIAFFTTLVVVLVFYNVSFFQSVDYYRSSERYQSFVQYFQPNHIFTQSRIRLTDPLPSCSIINPNLTINLLHHQWMIQHRHVHSDCSNYSTTERCSYHPNYPALDQSVIPSVNRSVESSHKVVEFRPRWLVFRWVHGTGGLADRLKGLLSCLSLAMLTGRAFSVEVDQSVNLLTTHTRSVLHWISADRLPRSVSVQSKSRRDLYWLDAETRPMKQTDWLIDCLNDCTEDLIVMTYNLNSFVDLLDNPRLAARYREFGFHAFTEKGDLDLYFDCLMSYSFTFTDEVTRVINHLMKSINRPQIKSWRQAEPTVPTLEQLIEAQSVSQPITLYQSEDQPIRQSAGQSGNQLITQSSPLFCVQLRMGKNAQFDSSNNRSISFVDSEAFLRAEQFTHIFQQVAHSISQYQNQSISQSINQSAHLSINLLITSESAEFEGFLPVSWRSSSTGHSVNQSINRLVIPGRSGHIDRMSNVDSLTQREALLNTVVTHYMIGECDFAAVSVSGFGTSALWRTRNRQIINPRMQQSVNQSNHQSIHQSTHPSDNQSASESVHQSMKDSRVFTHTAYLNKYLIDSSSGDLLSYRHMRGSGGRELESDYSPREPHVIQSINQSISQSIFELLSPSKYGKFQASSALLTDVPDDPLCKQFQFSND